MKTLTTKQVADYLGLNRETLRRWRLKKKGPPYIEVHGKRFDYPLDLFQEWYAKRLVKPEEG